MFLVRGLKEESYKAFGERIRREAEALVKEIDIQHVSYVITEEKPPKISIIPFQRKKIASITVKATIRQSIQGIENIQGFEGSYSVTEALPVSYNKTWPDGEKTPGVCLLTLFKQKKGIDYKTFLDRWHNSHTPLSLKIHPLWHYNRNVVDKKLTEVSAGWQGIVEEHMRTRSELLNPFKFFGNPLIIIPRMIKVYMDTKSFLDYKTIETYLAAEYHIKG